MVWVRVVCRSRRFADGSLGRSARSPRTAQSPQVSRRVAHGPGTSRLPYSPSRSSADTMSLMSMSCALPSASALTALRTALMSAGTGGVGGLAGCPLVAFRSFPPRLVADRARLVHVDGEDPLAVPVKREVQRVPAAPALKHKAVDVTDRQLGRPLHGHGHSRPRRRIGLGTPSTARQASVMPQSPRFRCGIFKGALSPAR